VRTASGEEYDSVPFAAQLVWTLAFDESLVVGASDRYEFQIIQPNGTTTMVERFWDPTVVTADEVDYWRRWTIALFKPREVDWNGENIPLHKPAYIGMLPSRSGELWLTRWGPGPSADCELPPEELAQEWLRDPLEVPQCLVGEIIVDVFDREGRYLGDVEDFPYFSKPFISGDAVLASTQDEAGTIMVKRYRLVLPGESSQ
jgi:hypothetical protein